MSQKETHHQTEVSKERFTEQSFCARVVVSVYFFFFFCKEERLLLLCDSSIYYDYIGLNALFVICLYLYIARERVQI